jgi:hypothetical protein
MVGRCGDRPQFRARNGPADGCVEMWSASLVGFDGAEVLHVPADAAAGVLPEPIHRRGEVARVSGGAPVVIGLWVDRRSLSVDSAVAVEGEGEERGGPVPKSPSTGGQAPIRHRSGSLGG